MTSPWFMLTLVGQDKPGMVAAISGALAAEGVTLGEASALRLGGNFTVMMMVSGDLGEAALRDALAPALEALGMSLHLEPIDGGLHQHIEPDVRVTVSGADRPGIVAQVTAVLADLDVNILDLESDVAGTEEAPLYVMQIAAASPVDAGAIDAALADVRASGVSVRVSAIQTYIG